METERNPIISLRGMFRPIASSGNSIDQRNKLNDSSSPTPPASCFIIGKNLIDEKIIVVILENYGLPDK